jgi:hypothetical protein
MMATGDGVALMAVGVLTTLALVILSAERREYHRVRPLLGVVSAMLLVTSLVTLGVVLLHTGTGP